MRWPLGWPVLNIFFLKPFKKVKENNMTFGETLVTSPIVRRWTAEVMLGNAYDDNVVQHCND